MKSWSEKIFNKNRRIVDASIFFAFAVSICFFVIGYTQAKRHDTWKNPVTWVTLVAFAVWYRTSKWRRRLDEKADAWIEPYFKALEKAKMGMDGERKVAEQMRLLSRKGYSAHRNVVLPGKSFDIDFVLVGTSGVIVVETKKYTGTFRVIGDRWFVKTPEGGWFKYPDWWNPMLQLERHIFQLTEFFGKVGISIKPRGALVLAGGVIESYHKPAYYLLKQPNELISFVEQLPMDSNMYVAQRDAVLQELKKLGTEIT